MCFSATALALPTSDLPRCTVRTRASVTDGRTDGCFPQQIRVQEIDPSSAAAASHLVCVGDAVKMCSAVFGEDMWACSDVSRIRWAICNRTTKIKLLLERHTSGEPVTWYHPGKTGGASSAGHSALELPVNLSTCGIEGWAADVPSPGRPLYATFHRNSQAGLNRRTSRTRALRAERLRHELAAAADMADDLMSAAAAARGRPPPNHPPLDASGRPGPGPAAGSSSSSSGGGSRSSTASTTPQQQQQQQQDTPLPSSPSSPSASPLTLTQQQAAVVSPLLPWLLVAQGRLSTSEMTLLASQCGLSRVLELGLASLNGNLAVRGASNEGLRSPSPTNNGSLRMRALVDAAASLQRLAVRRGYGRARSGQRGPLGTAVLLRLEAPGLERQLPTLLAAWLHWYGGMEAADAVAAAEGGPLRPHRVDSSLLEEAAAYLCKGALDRMNRVVLTWRYGGLSASVSGSLVGGWVNRVSMLRCRSADGCAGDTARGHFFLELQGLPPGTYYYKYVVDGTWTIDSGAAKELDALGNWNNVVHVPEYPPVASAAEELRLGRWQAACLAFGAKRGVAVLAGEQGLPWSPGASGSSAGAGAPAAAKQA